MATWTPVNPANLEPEKPIRATDIAAMNQNIIALAEGADNAPPIGLNAAPAVAAGTIVNFRVKGTLATFTAGTDSALTTRVSVDIVRRGRFRFTFVMDATNVSASSGLPVSYSATARWYRNGTAVGTLHTITNSTTSTTFSDDLDVAIGNNFLLRTVVDNQSSGTTGNIIIRDFSISSNAYTNFMTAVRI